MTKKQAALKNVERRADWNDAVDSRQRVKQHLGKTERKSLRSELLKIDVEAIERELDATSK